MVLEPGFGGCGFLESAVTVLRELGNETPSNNIYGCDRDPIAFDFLSQKLGSVDCNGKFIYADFLELTANDFSQVKFDTIIGNPPYVSHHNMDERQKATAISAMKSSGHSLDRRSSLWAYFIVHSLSFLKKGGRCAWVLPASFLHAKYSSAIKEIFLSSFSEIITVNMTERLFIESSAKEKTVILLANGFGNHKNKSSMSEVYAKNVDDLAQTLNPPSKTQSLSGPKLLSPIETAKNDRYFQRLSNLRSKLTLGNIAEIKIGIVTGANRFFVINESTRLKNSIPKRYTNPILSKMCHASGLDLSKSDIEKNLKADQRCLLVNLPEQDYENGFLAGYLSTFPEAEKHENKTFKKRKLWYRPCDGRTPDAFLSYMCDHGPRVVINNHSINSTNTIHRCYFKSNYKTLSKLISISILTSFSQISAEIAGRVYGSGVLKLEPSEAKQIELFLPTKIDEETINKTYFKINKLMRKRDLLSAQAAADALIYNSLDLSSPQILSSHFHDLLIKIREERRIRSRN